MIAANEHVQQVLPKGTQSAWVLAVVGIILHSPHLPPVSFPGKRNLPESLKDELTVHSIGV